MLYVLLTLENIVDNIVQRSGEDSEEFKAASFQSLCPWLSPVTEVSLWSLVLNLMIRAPRTLPNSQYFLVGSFVKCDVAYVGISHSHMGDTAWVRIRSYTKGFGCSSCEYMDRAGVSDVRETQLRDPPHFSNRGRFHCWLCVPEPDVSWREKLPRWTTCWLLGPSASPPEPCL